MSYEELVAVLKDYEAHFDQVLDEPKVYDALLAVVELCKPSNWDGDDNFYWKKQIIETIKRELKL